MSCINCLRGSSFWLLGVFAVIWAVGGSPSLAADNAPDMSGIITVTALDANGGVLAEAYPNLDNEWSSTTCGEPLELERGFPLSTDWDKPEGVCPPGSQSVVVNFEVVVKRNGAKTSCPYPMHPSKVLYIAKLDNGALVLLRLQAGTKPASVTARYLDKEYAMHPATPELVARIQATGDDLTLDWNTKWLETKVSLVDNKSLIASFDKAGQAKILDHGADLLAEILELYRTRWGGYPSSLSQLYTGSHAVITALPRNPFAWESNLSETEGALKLAGRVQYFCEGGDSGSQSETATGFWLAVVGKGAQAKPQRELPQGTKPPARTIRWIEQHHDPSA